MLKIPTGQHGVKNYKDDQTEIIMDGWIMPTLHNLGTATVYIQGIPVPPDNTYQFGPEGAIVNQAVNIVYEKDTLKTKKVAVSYFKLNNNCD